MFWSIFWFMLGGLSILHFTRIGKLDSKNPGMSLWSVLKLYWQSERTYIIISIIGWIAFTNLLNAGLAKILANNIFDYVVDTDDPTGIKFISFGVGLGMQGIITWVSKRQENSIERALEKITKKKDVIETETGKEVTPEAVVKMAEEEIKTPQP